MKIDIRSQLEPLEVLDLNKCLSVGTTVAQMEKCAIGARMIGEVTKSLEELIKSGSKPLVIYDGKLDTPLGKLLVESVNKKKWFSELVPPENFSGLKMESEQPILAIGNFSERRQDAVYGYSGRSFYINNCNQVKPGQVRDGFFPDFVHGDPVFILPVIFSALEERLKGKPISVRTLLDELYGYGGVAHQVAHGFGTLESMVNDPDCMVIATFSGIMTVSKMGGLIAEMIDKKMVQGIAATGALICHGFVEGVGLKHFKYNPKFTDAEMADQKLNRITDAVEPEENFDMVAEVLDEILNERISGEQPISPSEINRLIGEYLSEKFTEGPSILRSAYRTNIPVFIPASVDSELANDISVSNELRKRQGKKEIIVNNEIDSRKFMDMALKSKKMGIFSLGGGVPRNNIQNVAPLIEITSARLGLNLPTRMFSYGCRIDPTPPYLGNLSGCTYSEGGSWRKMDLKNGRFSEVLADATMVFPLYMAALAEKPKA